MNSAGLHQALYSRLANVTAVSSKVIGIYSEVPQAAQSEDDAAFPFITLGPHVFRPFDTDDDDGQQVAVQVHIWDRYTSELTRGALRDAVYDALHKFDLSISGANTVDCLFETANGFDDPDGKTHHIVMQFRVTYDSI